MKIYQNYVNLESRETLDDVKPFTVDDQNNNFIVHKKNLDSMADILLTLTDIKNGKILWTINTSAYDIGGCYKIDKEHIFTIM